jgi:hypothetical protein
MRREERERAKGKGFFGGCQGEVGEIKEGVRGDGCRCGERSKCVKMERGVGTGEGEVNSF